MQVKWTDLPTYQVAKGKKLTRYRASLKKGNVDVQMMQSEAEGVVLEVRRDLETGEIYSAVFKTASFLSDPSKAAKMNRRLKELAEKHAEILLGEDDGLDEEEEKGNRGAPARKGR